MKPEISVALTKCYFCGKDDKIVLNRLITSSMAARVEKMHGKVIDMDPCPKCKSFMQQGVILLTIDPNKSAAGWNKRPEGGVYSEPPTIGGAPNPRYRHWMPTPYRTGGFFVIKDEAVSRVFPPEFAEHALKHRFMFIKHEVAEQMGFFEVAQEEGK